MFPDRILRYCVFQNFPSPVFLRNYTILASIWTQFWILFVEICIPFSEQVFQCIVHGIEWICGTVNPRESYFYHTKIMICAKPPSPHILNQLLVFCSISASFWYPPGIRILYIFNLVCWDVVLNDVCLYLSSGRFPNGSRSLYLFVSFGKLAFR